MQSRKLGKTGLEVSEISFGAWQLGNHEDWKGMDDATAHRLVAEALELGVNLFDTAPNYASTNSERLLGEALQGKRGQVALVSKFGHRPQGSQDFSIDWFWESLNASLRRPQTDHLDVLLLHNPPVAMYQGDDPLWGALEAAKSEGMIWHYGASLDFAQGIEACLDNTGSLVLEIFGCAFETVSGPSFAVAGKWQPETPSENHGLLPSVPTLNADTTTIQAIHGLSRRLVSSGD